jgi:oxygen-independent coproporphyrinogen-3 oxidase
MYELAEELLADADFFHYEISNWARLDRGAQSAACSWWPGSGASGLATGPSEAFSPYVCSHNLIYWRNEPWLGVGAGAHSWMPGEVLSGGSPSTPRAVGGQRWANVDHPEDYLAAIAETACRTFWRRDVEDIDRTLEMGETMMLGLRLAEGVTAERFAVRFGVALADVFGEELTKLSRLGLLAWDGEVARLTARGRLLGNRVFERFI